MKTNDIDDSGFEESECERMFFRIGIEAGRFIRSNLSARQLRVFLLLAEKMNGYVQQPIKVKMASLAKEIGADEQEFRDIITELIDLEVIEQRAYGILFTKRFFIPARKSAFKRYYK